VRLHRLGGRAALSPRCLELRRGQSLQRIWRGSNTAGRHAVVDPLVNQEVYGKALLGIPCEDNITPLI
jgi:hypothetical protein